MRSRLNIIFLLTILSLGLIPVTGYAISQDIHVCKNNSGMTIYSNYAIPDKCDEVTQITYNYDANKLSVESDTITPPLTQQLTQSIAETPKRSRSYKPIRARESVKVTRIVDGDTIEIEIANAKKTVRIIGVDCPEKKQNWGKEATGFTSDFLSSRIAELEFDVQQTDPYGRLLAYVWSGSEMLNNALVKKGLAMVTTYPPNVKYVETFISSQKFAREAGEGFWKEGGLNETPYEHRKGNSTGSFH
jgi:micrococcal nuclease